MLPSCWSTCYSSFFVSSCLLIALLISNLTINSKLLNVVRADSDLLASASSWSQPPTNNPPTCQCAPRPVKYVAIEIPKIIKVPAPAPPQMMMPPAPSQQTKQTIIPITIPLLTHVPAPAPAPMPAPAPSTPPSDGWSAQSNPWSN